eukprot:Clim_evm41s142 gene=Clim_evmTU41s142
MTVRLPRIGTDIAHISRFRKILLSKHEDKFCKRILSEAEISVYKDRYKRHGPEAAAVFFAGRWAMKEALTKAFAAKQWLQWTHINTVHENHKDGSMPVVTLTGPYKQYAQELDAQEFQVSISHDGDYAIAMVMIS